MKGPVFSESTYILRAYSHFATYTTNSMFSCCDHKEKLSNQERVWKLWNWTGLYGTISDVFTD